ncbi:MAG: beta-phosphoglucomutase [Spirochaeta sp.]|jgi:beta-phosphoglucomutase|nr:beta-phosphoglucomutase [Spirochaeta sp.]
MKAVIFDLDGVVVYTDAYHYKAWKKLSDDQGWAFDESLNDQLRGVSRMASLQVILDHNGIDLPEEKKVELATRKNEDYRAFLAGIDDTALVDGALDFIRALRTRGVKIGLGSSSKNAMMVLEKLGIDSLFDEIVTGKDISRSKPDPEIFVKGAQRLGVEPAETYVFEDAVSGVDAAQAGGMVAVGFGPSEGLDHADVRVMRFADLDVDTFVATGKPA